MVPSQAEWPPRDARKPRSRAILAGAVAALLALTAAAFALRPTPAPAPPVSAPAAAKPAIAAPPSVPPPAPVVHPWLVHRDLAVTYAARSRYDDAFREVTASIADNAAAASADPALLSAAIAALSPKRATFVADAFRSNPKLVEALAAATAQGESASVRNAAYEGLRALGQEARADRVAMWMQDLVEVSSCRAIRSLFKKVRASKDPRLAELKSNLRKRHRNDPHVRCLKRYLKR